MTVVWWIVGIGLILVSLKLIILWAEPYMSFVPRRGSTPPPRGFEKIDLTASDGIHLSGWTTRIPDAGPVFLYFCGNAGNLSDREDMMTHAAASGLAIVAFNYRGTGESEGRATEQLVHRDAAEVYSHLVSQLGIDQHRIVVWGHSIGGAVASELAFVHPTAGAVLEGTFRSAHMMARRMLPFLPVSWFMTYKFDNEKNVRELLCPILFVHGSQDYTIPPKDSEFLHRLARDQKELWIVEGADHNNLYEVAGDAFFARLAQFGQRVVKTPHPA